MINFILSDDIEFNYSGLDVYNYSLYLSTNLITPIFSGKSYPFPQNIGTTKDTSIQLNDVVENYVKYDFNIVNPASIHVQKPVEFLLKVTGFSDVQFNVQNIWRKLGEPVGVNVHLNTKVRTNSYLNPIYVSYLVQDQPVDNTRFMIVKQYSKGVMINYQTLEVDADKNDLITFKFDPQNYLGVYPTLTDKLVFTDLVNFEDIGSFEDFTNTYEFNISQCSGDNYIYYVNRNGIIEMVGGTSGDKINVSSTVNDYKTDYRKWDGNSYEGNQSSFANTRNLINTTDTFVIKTKMLTDEEHNSVEDLYTSPYVWVLSGGILYSVLVSDTNYEQKNFRSDKLVNRTINLKKSITNKRR